MSIYVGGYEDTQSSFLYSFIAHCSSSGHPLYSFFLLSKWWWPVGTSARVRIEWDTSPSGGCSSSSGRSVRSVALMMPIGQNWCPWLAMCRSVCAFQLPPPICKCVWLSSVFVFVSTEAAAAAAAVCPVFQTIYLLFGEEVKVERWKVCKSRTLMSICRR